MKARQRTNVGDDRVVDVAKSNASMSRHVIKGHVDIGDVDDVTHRRRQEYDLRLVDSFITATATVSVKAMSTCVVIVAAILRPSLVVVTGVINIKVKVR